jgi:sugar lactone lactonase YvrE
MSAIDRFELSADGFSHVGHDLSHPECVLAEPDGTLWVSDNRGGATRIAADGSQALIGSIPGVPNGMAMDANGDLLIADIGDGKVYRLRRNGDCELVLDSMRGEPLGAVNFVLIDRHGRVWITVSTNTRPFAQAVRSPTADGYILRLDDGRARLVADRISFANEMRIDDEERFAYVAETALGRVIRMPMTADGGLGAPEPFGPERLFEGALVDGITFDEDGNLWVTELSRNAIAVITPDGRARIVYEDPDGKALLTPTSICFGGPDRRTAFIGSLKMARLVSFRAPIPGQALYHWRTGEERPTGRR